MSFLTGNSNSTKTFLNNSIFSSDAITFESLDVYHIPYVGSDYKLASSSVTNTKLEQLYDGIIDQYSNIKIMNNSDTNRSITIGNRYITFDTSLSDDTFDQYIDFSYENTYVYRIIKSTAGNILHTYKGTGDFIIQAYEKTSGGEIIEFYTTTRKSYINYLGVYYGDVNGNVTGGTISGTTGTFSSTITNSSLAASKVLTTNATYQLTSSDVTTTQLDQLIDGIFDRYSKIIINSSSTLSTGNLFEVWNNSSNLTGTALAYITYAGQIVGASGYYSGVLKSNSFSLTGTTPAATISNSGELVAASATLTNLTNGVEYVLISDTAKKITSSTITKTVLEQLADGVFDQYANIAIYTTGSSSKYTRIDGSSIEFISTSNSDQYIDFNDNSSVSGYDYTYRIWKATGTDTIQHLYKGTGEFIIDAVNKTTTGNIIKFKSGSTDRSYINYLGVYYGNVVGNLTGNVTGSISGGTVAGSTGTFTGAVSTGALSSTTGTFTGAVSGTTGTFTGAVSTGALTSTTGTFTGALTGTTGTFSGALSSSNFPAFYCSKFKYSSSLNIDAQIYDTTNYTNRLAINQSTSGTLKRSYNSSYFVPNDSTTNPSTYSSIQFFVAGYYKVVCKINITPYVGAQTASMMIRLNNTTEIEVENMTLTTKTYNYQMSIECIYNFAVSDYINFWVKNNQNYFAIGNIFVEIIKLYS